MPPDISVIVPAWNRAEIIGRAIRSVAAAGAGLSAGLSVELIVVDDGSVDDTVGAAERAIAAAGLRAKVLRQANAGPGAARNRGAAAARGAWLAFLDSDDHWFAWTLRHVMAALAGDERPAFLFLQTIDIAEGRAPEVAEAAPAIRRCAGYAEAVAANPLFFFGSGNVVVRRDVFEALGGFTTETFCAEDRDLFMRGVRHGGCTLLTGAPLLARDVGRGDRLTAAFPGGCAGLRFLLAQHRRGAYPEPPTGPGARTILLARAVRYTARIGFDEGSLSTAYGLYFRHIGLLVAEGNWRWIVKLPLMPVLNLLEPAGSFSRWRSARRG